MSALYVVATPIGNLEDMTLRAIRVLREAPLIAAEDTRLAKRLLQHYAIATPVTSFYEHNKRSKLPALMAHLETADLALVTDAGTPGVSDPGSELVAAAAAAGVTVIPVPGPSAIVTALSVAGFPADTFHYEGFLPRHSGERRRRLGEVAPLPHTLVLLEAPHRVRDTLADLLATLGDRPLTVCRELTKRHEELFRGTIADALAHFVQPRGEFVLVIGGASAPPPPSDSDVRAQIAAGLAQGVAPSQLAAIVAARSGLPRQAIYQRILAQREEMSQDHDEHSGPGNP